MINDIFLNNLDKVKKKEDLLRQVSKLKIKLNNKQSEYFLALSINNFEEDTHLEILKMSSKSVKEKCLPGLFSKYFTYFKDDNAEFVANCIKEVLLSVEKIDDKSEKIIFYFFSKNEHEKFVNVYKILACLLQTKYKIYFLNKFLNCQKNKFINEQRNLQHEIESTSLLATKNSFTTKSNELVEDNVFVFHSFLTNQKLELSLVKESISDPLFLYLCKPISDPSFIIKNKQNILAQLDRLYNFTENTNNLVFFYNLIVYFYNPRFSLIYDLVEYLENDFALDLIYLLVLRGLDRKELKFCFDSLIYLDKPIETRLGILKVISLVIFHYGAMDDFIREWIKVEGKGKTNNKIKSPSIKPQTENESDNLLEIYKLSLPNLIQNIKLEIIPCNDLPTFFKYNKSFYRKVTQTERDTASSDNAMVMANLIWKELLFFKQEYYLNIILEILIVIIHSTKRFYSARMQSTDYLDFIYDSFDYNKPEYILFIQLIIKHFKLNKKYFEKTLLILLKCYKENIILLDLIYELCKFDVYFFYYLIKDLEYFKKEGFKMIKKVKNYN